MCPLYLYRNVKADDFAEKDWSSHLLSLFKVYCVFIFLVLVNF